MLKAIAKSQAPTFYDFFCFHAFCFVRALSYLMKKCYYIYVAIKKFRIFLFFSYFLNVGFENFLGSCLRVPWLQSGHSLISRWETAKLLALQVPVLVVRYSVLLRTEGSSSRSKPELSFVFA